MVFSRRRATSLEQELAERSTQWERTAKQLDAQEKDLQEGTAARLARTPHLPLPTSCAFAL